MGLLAIPGAAAWASQARLKCHEFFEPFAGTLVAGGDRNFRAAGCGRFESEPRRNLFVWLRRIRTPGEFGFGDELLFCDCHGGFVSLLCRIQFTGSGWRLQDFGAALRMAACSDSERSAERTASRLPVPTADQTRLWRACERGVGDVKLSRNFNSLYRGHLPWQTRSTKTHRSK
jgi:hypothetical protein